MKEAHVVIMKLPGGRVVAVCVCETLKHADAIADSLNSDPSMIGIDQHARPVFVSQQTAVPVLMHADIEILMTGRGDALRAIALGGLDKGGR